MSYELASMTIAGEAELFDNVSSSSTCSGSIEEASRGGGTQRRSTAVLWKPGYDTWLWNEDLGPLQEQTWEAYNIFAFWMSDVHSLGGYITAASLFSLGISSWQVLVALLIGMCIVMCLCNLISKPSQTTGTPFPVVARIAFGVYGANVPAVIRGLQSVPFYGINTWLAGNSLQMCLLKFFPALAPLADVSRHGFLQLSALGWVTFVIMWLLQALLFWGGMESIRKFVDLAGPAVYVTMIMLAAYLSYQAGGVSLSVATEHKDGWASASAMVEAVAITVSFFAGPMLNFGDFSRYACSQKAVTVGNLLGGPVNFLGFALLTVITNAATPKVFGVMIDDPVQIVKEMDSFAAALLGALTFSLSGMGVNVVANFISPSFDFSNVAPQHISMRTGGMIAAVGAIVVMPWELYNNPETIQYTLGALGSFMGPLFGIMLAEYYVVTKQRIDLDGLFSTSETGPYWYQRGYNLVALISLVPSTLAPLACVYIERLHSLRCYTYFIGTGMSFILYALASHGRVVQRTAQGAPSDGKGELP